jgi:7,8-dihydro-6-hydroxymethylpterin-pyrophosphokinase
MRDEHLRDAIHFLSRIAVGRLDEERLLATIAALEKELGRRRDERARQRTDG